MTKAQVEKSSDGTLQAGFKERASREFRPSSHWRDKMEVKFVDVAYTVVNTDSAGSPYYRYGLLTDAGDCLYLSMLLNTTKRVKKDGKTVDHELKCDLFDIANKYRSDLHPEYKGKGEEWAAEQIIADCKDKTFVVERSEYFTAIVNYDGKVQERETTFPLFNFKKG